MSKASYLSIRKCKYLFIIEANNFERQPAPPPGIKVCFVEAAGDIKHGASLSAGYNLHFLTDATVSQLVRN